MRKRTNDFMDRWAWRCKLDISAHDYPGRADGRRTSRRRLDAADRSRTRPTIQLQELSIGQEVEIWFDKGPKEQSGWRGPAKIVSIQTDDDDSKSITVRYQGRTLERGVQHVQPHLAHVIFLTSQEVKPNIPWLIVREAAEFARIVSILLVPSPVMFSCMPSLR